MVTGQGYFGRPGAAANRFFGLKEEDGTAGFGQRDSGRQSIWT
jgi:hypothetical protein